MDMVAALAKRRPHFLSWMVAGEALCLGQLNPELERWSDDYGYWFMFGEKPPKLDLKQFAGELTMAQKEFLKKWT